MKKRYFTKSSYVIDDDIWWDQNNHETVTVYSPDDVTVNSGILDHLGNPILYVEEFNPIGFFAKIEE